MKRKKPCGCGTPGCYDIPELTNEEIFGAKKVPKCTCGADDMNHIKGCPRWFQR